ncbi:bifunctional DNA-formamidopyrimidine glycosylase/DNA-(apurinic or apyrimidinic site) lyase [Roseibium album]|uniref:bifunctional DNA-formamidopyrimidine glycosylase/DNA-(apurinic or apyrimidinic site) lyase n=1 Tax=Roseibium album TaxID=311410 RepID=UPI0018CA89B2|nr:bifunctional DNA-formamidopyrimidine glycosylase/DNA-(apurinic or apyrimidinic site) lyase [Roseibium album]MBG6164578.1 formamidopyrimidine-DNA glycosylase [Labrenzia sp. EL_195]MCR9057440.1 bifunctional DNA-formamidopyrimidine glycosylase/DNA-(apurinic or apyrimidinic site) lyase [Paracoccaceae bacterium]
MPELPEVETVKRGLAPTFEGAKIVSVDQNRPDLRFAFPDRFASRLAGQRVAALSRRSKYLLADIDSGDVLVMHLGMSGSFRVENDSVQHAPGDFAHERNKDPKHDHVVFHLKTSESATARIIYNDPRRFGFMTLIPRPQLDEHAYFKDLGMEPLGNDLSGETLARLFAGRKSPLKAALLNQKLIAGLGNIYVCEALWRSGLSPERVAGTLTTTSGKPTKKAEELAIHIRETLHDAIRAGGSSLRDHTQADGTLGYFQHSFAVYDREGEACRKKGCKGTIARLVQSNRSTFHCPVCQS